MIGWKGKMRAGHTPGEMPIGIDGDVDEQRAEDEQVCAVINSVFYQSCFYLSGDGEASWTCIRLHEGNQEPAHMETRPFKFIYTSAKAKSVTEFVITKKKCHKTEMISCH